MNCKKLRRTSKALQIACDFLQFFANILLSAWACENFAEMCFNRTPTLSLFIEAYPKVQYHRIQHKNGVATCSKNTWCDILFRYNLIWSYIVEKSTVLWYLSSSSECIWHFIFGELDADRYSIPSLRFLLNETTLSERRRRSSPGIKFILSILKMYIHYRNWFVDQLLRKPQFEFETVFFLL